MLREHCPECGHLLSKTRSECHFCGWFESIDQCGYTFEVKNDLSHRDPSELRIDQQPGF